MKGLLLKDLYMSVKYGRSFLLFVLVFLAVSFVSRSNTFFLLYPCMFCSMLPLTLLGYDERSHWQEYACTLPCSRAAQVSVKYLLCLIFGGAALLLSGICAAVQLQMSGSFSFEELSGMLVTMLTVALVTPALSLPWIFKLGIEKGRIAFYVVIGATVAAGFILGQFIQPDLSAPVAPGLLLALLCLGVAALFGLSWYLSIVFYRRREF